jgi:hypothetical protein
MMNYRKRHRPPSKSLSFRIPEIEAQAIRELAENHFGGSISLLCRNALQLYKRKLEEFDINLLTD